MSTAYGYDGASRLTSLAHTLPVASNSQTLTFAYSPADQIRTRGLSNNIYSWSGGRTVNRGYSANGLNQLTTSGSLTLAYDGQGNLRSDGVNTYGYDVVNNLTRLSGTATLSYDALGRLTQTSGAAVTRFAYDNDEAIGEYSSAGALLRRYVHGPSTDEPIAWYEGSGTADRRWLIADNQGSVIAVTNASGALMGSAPNTYDEYGVPAANNLGRFQYTGQMYVPEVGIYHYKARAYSPTLGRILQTDPIGYNDNLDLYAYVDGDPLNLSDPMGLTWQSNWNFFWSWATGGGQQNRSYGPNTKETQEMEQGNGANVVRNVFAHKGSKNADNIAYSTSHAFFDTIFSPSSTPFQVGGFAGATATNNGNGTVTYTIPNTAGTHSFFYHLVPDQNGNTGPMRNINQTFTWTEALPCGCH